MKRGALLLAPLAFAGCASFYDEILLNADGSGTYRLTVYTKMAAGNESLEALRAGVQERASRIAAAAGFTLMSVDLKRDGPLLQIEVAATFRDLSAFASPALAVSADASQWGFVVPREMKLEGRRFSARVLATSAPLKGHPIRASFPGREGRFTVHFPGEVVEANGERNERLANWNFPLEMLCDSPVLMTAAYRSDFPLLAAALGGALVAALAVLLVQAFRRRRAA